MTVVMIAFVAALFFAAISTPAVRALAFRLGLICMPRSDRGHTKPTPLMGGVAIYVGATVALLLGGMGARSYLGGWGNLGELAGILSGATLMAAVGLWDDRVRLGWGVKLLAQLAAIAVQPVDSGRCQAHVLAGPDAGDVAGLRHHFSRWAQRLRWSVENGRPDVLSATEGTAAA